LWQAGLGPVTLAHGHRENHKLRKEKGCEWVLCDTASEGDSIVIAKCRRSYSPRGPRRRRCFGSVRFPGPLVRRRSAAPYSAPPVASAVGSTEALDGTSQWRWRRPRPHPRPRRDRSTRRLHPPSRRWSGSSSSRCFASSFSSFGYWFEAPGRALWVE